MIKEKITEGFYGCYWPCEGADAAIMAMLGDDCEDYMAKSAVKWIHKKYGVSVMTLSPAHKDYGHHNMPVFIRLFKAGKEYPSECRKTREDVDIKMSDAINEWKK